MTFFDDDLLLSSGAAKRVFSAVADLPVIDCTALFCITCNLVPSPSIIPERTVSLACANRLYGARAG